MARERDREGEKERDGEKKHPPNSGKLVFNGFFSLADEDGSFNKSSIKSTRAYSFSPSHHPIFLATKVLNIYYTRKVKNKREKQTGYPSSVYVNKISPERKTNLFNCCHVYHSCSLRENLRLRGEYRKLCLGYMNLILFSKQHWMVAGSAL